MYVDDIKLTGKKQNIDPMWKVLEKKLIWENQRHSLITSTWDAFNGSAEQTKILSTIHTNMFESRIYAGATEKLPSSGRPDANVSTWSYDMGVMQRNVWKYIANWLIRRLNNSSKHLLHASMTTTIKKKN